MSFKIFSALTLLGCAFAQSSQVTTVLNDITAIDSDVQTLIAAINAYQGGIVGQTPLLADLTQVHLATRKGYYDSLTLPSPLSTTDAESIIQLVNHTLSVDNPKAVRALESKKPLLQPTGTDPAIKAGLEVLLSDHLAFSNQVLERTPESLLPDANEVVDVITNALEDGIAAFSD